MINKTSKVSYPQSLSELYIRAQGDNRRRRHLEPRSIYTLNRLLTALCFLPVLVYGIVCLASLDTVGTVPLFGTQLPSSLVNTSVLLTFLAQ